MGKIQGKPQFLIFSATIPKGLRHFLRKYLENVKTITIKEDNLTTKNIEHYMLQCKAKNKEEIFDFLAHPVPFCRYCNPDIKDYSLNWEPTTKKIDEWT